MGAPIMQKTRRVVYNLTGLLQKFSSRSIRPVHEQRRTVADVEGGGQGNVFSESLLNAFDGRTAAGKKLGQPLNR